MPMKIELVTSNQNKVKEFELVLEPEIIVDHTKHEYVEIQSNDPIEVAKESAQRVANEMGRPIVVEDSGLFIDVLNGFPGTLSKYVHQKIGLKGILKLLEHEPNRLAAYRSVVAYCEPKRDAEIFLGEERGTIAVAIKGTFGFGHDPIFIPEGSAQTYGEMEDASHRKKFRKRAIQQLKDFLLMK